MMHVAEQGACLCAELVGGHQDDDAWGVAHGEAVADALLLLAHALHQRQQVRQRLAATCRQESHLHPLLSIIHAPVRRTDTPYCVSLQLVKDIQAKRRICLQNWCMLSTWPCCKAGKDSTSGDLAWHSPAWSAKTT